MQSKAGNCFGVFLIACIVFSPAESFSQQAGSVHNSLLSQLSPVKIVSLTEANSINPYVLGAQLVAGPVEKPQATIFINPDNGDLMILIKGTKKIYDAEIRDMNGKCIRQFKFSGANEINTTDMPAGIYSINIKDLYRSGENYSEKILIK